MKVVRILAAVILAAVPMCAQDVTASVQGYVADATGARIPGVHVELINEGTKLAVSRTANTEGEYQFNLVAPGQYTVQATAGGFKGASVTGIDVGVNKTTRVDLTLTVGSTSDRLRFRPRLCASTRCQPRYPRTSRPRW
jgi:Cna protein B-type domain.